MDKKQAVEILETAAAAYPRFEIDEKRFEVWIKLLKDKDFKLSMKRLERHIFKSSFPPTIADVAADPKPVNEFLEKTKRWEAEVNAERAGKQRS